jgi:hypothetical protein
MADETTVWCDYERAFCPRNEFEPTPRWGMVHNVDPRHTVKGTVLRDVSRGRLEEREVRDRRLHGPRPDEERGVRDTRPRGSRPGRRENKDEHTEES